MSKKAKIFLLFCFLASFQKIQAQEFFLPGPEDKPQTIQVGEKKVVFFNVIGTTKDAFHPKIKLSLPETFKLLTETHLDSLKIGEFQQLFFTFQVSPSAPHGVYPIKIEFFEKDEFRNSYAVNIEVLKNRKIEIFPIQKPEFINQKPQQELQFLVKNIGNVEETVALSSRSGQIVGDKKIVLKSGESKMVKTNNDLPQVNSDFKHISFDLQANISEIENPFVSIFTVPLFSFANNKNDPYQRFPVQASLMYNYFNTNVLKVNSIQYSFSGKGFIDAKEKHQLEFIARGPNKFNLPRFGNIDQHFLGYEHSGLTIHIGDKMFVLSNLIESSRFAKGLEIKKKFGEFEFGGFYFKPRFFKEIHQEYGFTAEYKKEKGDKYRIILLQKDHEIKKIPVSTTFLGGSATIIKKHIWFNTEASISKTNNQFSHGFYNNAYLDLPKIKAYSNFIFTGKTFNGYYTNSLLSTHSVQYFVNKRMRVGASNNISHINPSLDYILYTTSPFFNNNSVDFSYDFSKKHKARIMYMKGEKEDKFEVKAYHYKEQFMRYIINSKINSFSFIFDGDLGKTQNLLTQTDTKKTDQLFRTRLNTQYNNDKNFNISGFVEYLNTTRYRDAELKSKYFFYGFRFGAQIKNMLFVNLNYKNNFTPDELYKSQSFWDGTVELHKNHQELSLMTSYGYTPIPINEKNLYVSLRYSINLDMPIRKKKGLSKVIGKINGVKNSGVILNLNGQKIISNQTGEFVFNDILPGKYHLMVNQSSLGFGNILASNGPIEVNLNANEEKSLNLEVVKSGKITGQLASRNNPNLPLENILIELYKDGFSQITNTDKNGAFSFSELKEQAYSIRIISSEINKKYILLNSDLNLNVSKGETTTFAFVLDEKKKKITFQDDTIVLIEK